MLLFPFFRRNARTFEQKVSLFLALAALFGVYTLATFLYRRLSLFVKRLRRPTYYEKERERRRKLADARREVRRHHTLNPRPTFDAIRAALHTARGSPEAALRLGSLLEDLECFVDNTLRFDGQGRIVGRKGGIKRLLQREAPDLFKKYSTIMRYKALAKRFRQACGSGEPVHSEERHRLAASSPRRLTPFLYDGIFQDMRYRCFRSRSLVLS